MGTNFIANISMGASPGCRKKIADVKIVPEPFRIGDEGGARTNKKFSQPRIFFGDIAARQFFFPILPPL